MHRVYLDHAATTPLDPEVLAAMMPLLNETFGNPSSSHYYGREARAKIDESRDAIAAALGAQAAEIYFTSGGTEADNLAIIGAVAASHSPGAHIVTQVTEHHAVLDTCRWLETEGYRVTYLPADRNGMVDPDDLARAITDNTVLASIMHANNEIGTIQPIHELARICRERGVLFHTDAVQTFGLLPIDVKDFAPDFISISAHKLYGPKGTGALYVRRGVEIAPLFHGGNQERTRRPGTENPAGIVGFAEAARIARRGREETVERISGLRDYFVREAVNRIGGVSLNGHRTQRLPGNANLSFEGVVSESLLFSLDLEGVAVSGGSACTAGSIEPSHVLCGIGLPPERAGSAIRFSLGRKTTKDEIDYTLDVLQRIVGQLRG